jgi:pimeloyl-ACP methyl ester carboxylesterase
MNIEHNHERASIGNLFVNNRAEPTTHIAVVVVSMIHCRVNIHIIIRWLSSRRAAMSSSIESRFILIGNVRVHYNLVLPNVDIRRGTIVLIHGFLCSTFTWSTCLQELADRTGCRVLAYDRLGFGFTERQLDGQLYTRTHEQRLAVDLLEQLNITDRVHLVSSSSGATVAFDIAMARADLVCSLILIAPYGLARVTHPTGAFARFLIGTKTCQSLLKFGLTRFLPFRNAYYNQDLSADERTRQGYLKPIETDPLFVPCLALFMQYNHVPSVNDTVRSWAMLESDLSILFVIAEHDRIVQRHDIETVFRTCREQRSNSSRTDLVTIERCGHLPQEERPNEFIECIRQFIG